MLKFSHYQPRLRLREGGDIKPHQVGGIQQRPVGIVVHIVIQQKTIALLTQGFERLQQGLVNYDVGDYLEDHVRRGWHQLLQRLLD